MDTDHSVTANFLNKPTLAISPTSKTCRTYHENFVVTITISNAPDAASYDFELHYDTTLLDYVSVTWGLWGTGTINVNEAGGIITVSKSGTPTGDSGTQTLVTITFTASYFHIWKSGAGYTNDLTGTIYFQTISTGYPTGPALQYTRPDTTQINVGPDFSYTFSPIQGDVDLNGVVNVFDLRTVAAYFDTNNPTYDLLIDGIIDVGDIHLITNNFDFHYVPPP
jgi:hypothetical protein